MLRIVPILPTDESSTVSEVPILQTDESQYSKGKHLFSSYETSLERKQTILITKRKVPFSTTVETSLVREVPILPTDETITVREVPFGLLLKPSLVREVKFCKKRKEHIFPN